MSGNHYTVANTPTMHALSVIESFSTTYSAVFTAPNTSNNSMGVIIPINRKRFTATTNLVAILQEDATGAFSGAESDVAIELLLLHHFQELKVM